MKHSREEYGIIYKVLEMILRLLFMFIMVSTRAQAMDSTLPTLLYQGSQPPHKASPDAAGGQGSAHPGRAQRVEGRRNTDQAISPCLSLGVAELQRGNDRWKRNH